MNRALIVPLAMLGYYLALLFYFGHMYLHPLDYLKFGWAAYDHFVQVFSLFIILSIFIHSDIKNTYDKHFLCIWAGTAFALSITIGLQGLGFICHTYGLIIAIIGVTLTTLLILIVGGKHGYFKTTYEND